MAHTLTPVDRALIEALQDNGRAPFTQIARELGITEKTARKRVGDLVERGVIQIVTITDPRLLGYHAMALVAITLDSSRPPSAVASELAAVGAIDYVIVTTGRFNVLVEVLAADTQALARVIEEDVLAVPGIATTEVFPYLRLEYQEPRFLAARAGRAARRPAADSIDDVDRAILSELSGDGRMPFQTVAHALSVSEAQVRQRVNRMIESGAAQILALTDAASLGFRTSAWLSIKAGPGASVTELAKRIAQVPSITYVAITAGRFDIFAEAVCVDEDDLLVLLDEQLRPLAGVGRVEASVFLDLRYKRVSAPK
jgi:DNA-binding Lrp family transcriptional regulator